MKLGILAAAAAFALAGAGGASAAVTVLGDSTAQQCSEAAHHDQSDMFALQLCTEALMKGTLDRRDEAGTYINRGVMQMARRDYTDAGADFDRATQIDPTLGEGWINRGAIDILNKRYQDGINDIDKGLALGTEEPAKAYYNRAVSYEGIDDEKSAYLDYEEALVLAPGWDLPRQELLRFTVTRR